MPWTPDSQTLAVMQANLKDAYSKRHLLMTGRLSVEVEVEGRMVRYMRTDTEQLTAYIEDLERKISNRPARHGAIGFIF